MHWGNVVVGNAAVTNHTYVAVGIEAVARLDFIAATDLKCCGDLAVRDQRVINNQLGLVAQQTPSPIAGCHQDRSQGGHGINRFLPFGPPLVPLGLPIISPVRRLLEGKARIGVVVVRVGRVGTR